MKGAPVVGPASHLDEDRDVQAFRLILWNNWDLKISLQEITCCHRDYLFIFTPVNSYTQEIKKKNSMLFYWEDCEERNQKPRRSSVCISSTLFFFETISVHTFTFKRTCVCSMFLQVLIFSFLGVSMQTLVAWDRACKTPDFLLFHFWNFYNSFFNSLFTSPIVSLWGRKIRQCLSWLTAQYEQWRDSFPTIQSLKSVILRSESWKINQWEEIFYRMWLLYCCSLQWMSDLQAPQITLRIAPYFHALLGSEITKERN